MFGPLATDESARQRTIEEWDAAGHDPERGRIVDAFLDGEITLEQAGRWTRRLLERRRGPMQTLYDTLGPVA